MPTPELICAAGAVVVRRRKGRHQVLAVHRPKYDDWSLPKGKLDPGESPRTTAVREVLEETGARIRLGAPLSVQAYPLADSARAKLVHYWVGRVLGDYDPSAYRSNEEIDRVRWVDVERAAALLTHSRDLDTVAEALPFARRTSPLLVLRHGEARPRKQWSGDDRERTLADAGTKQAQRLAPILAAYGVERLVSSSSRRCWTTLEPYGARAGVDVAVTDALTEEDATETSVADTVDRLVRLRKPAVLCSHRPVLPMVFDALRVDPPRLAPAAMLVVHHRRGRIAALERVPAP